LRVFGPTAEPVLYVDKDWASEPYSRGATPGARAGRLDRHGLEPSADSLSGHRDRHPLDGHMDGAIQSGRRAAAEVMRAGGAALTAAAGGAGGSRGAHGARVPCG
jgi:monoamine oxidase